jgi:hypothetical protein
MRHLLTVGAMLFLALLPGCGTTRFGWLKQPERTPPPADIPTTAKLVDYLNENARRVQTLRCEDVALTCSMGLQSIGLTAQMVAEKPKNFRMGGQMAGKDVVDLGSNDQEFWFWSSYDNPPRLNYCTYKDWNDGAARNVEFPFQPDWILETMGLGPYGPPERYRQEHDADTVRLVEKTVGPQGQAVRKVIVFQRRPRQAPTPQVTQYLLLDDRSGREICSARILEVQLDSARTNAILPRRMELNWPEKRVRLNMKLDRLAVNGQAPTQAFQRPRLQGVPAFNMATRQVDGASPIGLRAN